MLSRGEMQDALTHWFEAWNEHCLDRVMDLLDDQVLFENWTGARVRGKEALRRAWKPWFADHGGFRFIEEDVIIDQRAQSAVCRWTLEWPSPDPRHAGQLERRRGVDILRFRNTRIVEKLAYSKTAVAIPRENGRSAFPED